MFIGRNPESIFEIETRTGELRVRSSLDRELYFKHQLEICARDSGNRVQLVSKPCARIELTILDLNDNRPQFYLFYDDQSSAANNNNISNNSSSLPFRNRLLDFYVEENCTENTFVAWLKAFDTDAGENASLTYSLESTSTSVVPFWIDPHGIVRNTKRIRLLDQDDEATSENNTSGNLSALSTNIFFTRQRTFLVKVTATDSSKGKIKLIKNDIKKCFI